MLGLERTALHKWSGKSARDTGHKGGDSNRRDGMSESRGGNQPGEHNRRHQRNRFGERAGDRDPTDPKQSRLAEVDCGLFSGGAHRRLSRGGSSGPAARDGVDQMSDVGGVAQSVATHVGHGPAANHVARTAAKEDCGVLLLRRRGFRTLSAVRAWIRGHRLERHERSGGTEEIQRRKPEETIHQPAQEPAARVHEARTVSRANVGESCRPE